MVFVVGCFSKHAVMVDSMVAWHGRDARVFGCSVIGCLTINWLRVVGDTEAAVGGWHRLGEASKGRGERGRGRSRRERERPRPVWA